MLPPPRHPTTETYGPVQGPCWLSRPREFAAVACAMPVRAASQHHASTEHVPSPLPLAAGVASRMLAPHPLPAKQPGNMQSYMHAHKLLCMGPITACAAPTDVPVLIAARCRCCQSS